MANELAARFAQIEKQSKEIAINSMQKVANKAFNAAGKKALSCLKQYYTNYKPKRYKRTNQLKKAIKVYKPKETKKGSTYRISFAIKYDSSPLVGVYRSNSWYHQSGRSWIPVMHTWNPDYIKNPMRDTSIGQNNGIPEAGWILNNYLEGIHPWAQADGESTKTIMTNYFEKELPAMAGDMIYSEMLNAIMGILTK